MVYHAVRNGKKLSTWTLHRVDSYVVALSELLFLKMKILRSFEMSMTNYQSTRRNIAEDLNFQEDLYVLFFGLQNVFCAVEIWTSSFVSKYSALTPKHYLFIKSHVSYKKAIKQTFDHNTYISSFNGIFRLN